MTRLDYFPEPLFEGEEIPEYLPRRRQRFYKSPKKLILSAIGIIALIAVGICAAVVRTDNPEAKEQSQIDKALDNLVKVRFEYVEKMTRTDTNPKALTNPGWYQQAVAITSQGILDGVEVERTNFKSPNYRLSKQAVLMKSEVDANELILLGASGEGAKLTYQNNQGEEKTIELRPSELATLGMNKLAAIDLALNLEHFVIP